ncbi:MULTISPECIES: hypothetical protein [unclassified Microbacterium]|uniref:AbiTii domain-containing protein n=1 Tax=unclassified Microbacterium TaxID=2609290 RepID=UPI000CFC66B0|nr:MULTISPECIES: hypothetical protein [unclassified Microbacterium]PQZ53152.1 hypothetical protein CQ032_15720 [Microbacterium sp. MYb43]PQZ74694.1 hypothetical protein CQ031_15065 [Microbacterium sp. MYb40]PRB18782.1 hypothetical protein CQ040_16370 [Microbacterium sp. MYb54]PRB23642.1 hypothetical protein CQ037_17170 [Microbacterium sp. MYb50]PRB63349.1 hypothetical protein CQ021_16735 [Microbacterium sp. MYb24]
MDSPETPKTDASPPSLLSEIERDLLDDVPVSTVLRKLIILGGYAGTSELRDWAARELQGYIGVPEDQLPRYRIVPAIIQVDAAVPQGFIKHQTIGVHELPEEIREEISHNATFRQGVGELEAMVITYDESKTVQIMLPGATAIANLIDYSSGRRDQKITAIYWAVSTSAITGLLDQVRTRMAQMLGELRAVTPAGAALPNPVDASKAVSIVIHGKNNRVSVAHAASGGVASTAEGETEGRFWTTGRRIGAALVGACTIAATVIAWFQFQAGG